MNPKKAIASIIISLLGVTIGANAQAPRAVTFVRTSVQVEGTEVTRSGENCTLTFRWSVPSELDPNLRNTVLTQLNDSCKTIEKLGLANEIEGHWRPSEKATSLWSSGPKAVERALPSRSN